MKKYLIIAPALLLGVSALQTAALASQQLDVGAEGELRGRSRQRVDQGAMVGGGVLQASPLLGQSEFTQAEQEEKFTQAEQEELAQLFSPADHARLDRFCEALEEEASSSPEGLAIARQRDVCKAKIEALSHLRDATLRAARAQALTWVVEQDPGLSMARCAIGRRFLKDLEAWCEKYPLFNVIQEEDAVLEDYAQDISGLFEERAPPEIKELDRKNDLYMDRLIEIEGRKRKSAPSGAAAAASPAAAASSSAAAASS